MIAASPVMSASSCAANGSSCSTIAACAAAAVPERKVWSHTISRKSPEFTAARAEYGLHHGSCDQRTDALRAQQRNRTIDAFDGLRAHSIERRVGELEQISRQRGIANDQGRQLAARHVVVVHGAHQLREEQRPARRIAGLRGRACQRRARRFRDLGMSG